MSPDKGNLVTRFLLVGCYEADEEGEMYRLDGQTADVIIRGLRGISNPALHRIALVIGIYAIGDDEGKVHHNALLFDKESGLLSLL